jgi:hypothetical protein
MSDDEGYVFARKPEYQDMKNNFWYSGWLWGFMCGLITMLIFAIGVIFGLHVNLDAL